MAFNKKVVAAKYALVARCFGIDTTGLTILQAAEKAIEAVVELNNRIQIPKTLAEVGVSQEQLLPLSKKAFLDSCHQTNPRPCQESDLLELYKAAFGQ